MNPEEPPEFSTPGPATGWHRQLVIGTADLPKVTLPIEDLGVVIVDDIRATYTQSFSVASGSRRHRAGHRSRITCPPE